MQAPVNKLNDATLRLRWTLDNLISADGHRLTATFACSVKILPEPAEQKFFAETFLGSSSGVQTGDIVAHFAPGLRAAATELANPQTSESIAEPATQDRWLAALKKSTETIAFSCGLAVLPPFAIQISSPSLQQQRTEQMQRTLAQQASASRVEHFKQAAELLQQWETLRSSSPNLAAGKLLEQLNPADRGEMLRTLLLASAGQSQTARLWAVAGDKLLRFEIGQDSPKSDSISLPTTAGPLRSVQQLAHEILIGAQNGVLIRQIESPDPPEIYLDSAQPAEHGFTRIVKTDGMIWACHHDRGVVGWRVGEFAEPAVAVRPTQLNGAAKHLVLLENRVLFAVGSRLLSLNEHAAVVPIAEMSDEIVSLLTFENRLLVITRQGNVSIHRIDSLAQISTLRPLARLSAATVLPWLNSARLVLAGSDGPVQCFGLEDSVVTQYTSPHLGVRQLTASATAIAALSADRQRIVVWNAWDGRHPLAEINAASLARHRLTDICLA